MPVLQNVYSYLYFETRPQLIKYISLLHLATTIAGEARPLSMVHGVKQRVCFILHQIHWMMPMSSIVPIPCAAATEGVVQLPADLKRPSKLSGAWARRAARRKVLEHVALGHGNRVVQRKSPPLVGFNSFPVTSLLLLATAATSPPMSMEATSPSPPLGKLSPPPARRSPWVEAQVVPVIQYRSWQCHSCTYKQEFVTGSRTCVMCHSTRRRYIVLRSLLGRVSSLCGRGVVANLIVPTVVSPSGAKLAYLLAMRNASMIYG